MPKGATAAQVQKHLRGLGHDVKIGRNGFVQIKFHGLGKWQSGQWVRDYIVTDQGSVLLLRVDPNLKPPLRRLEFLPKMTLRCRTGVLRLLNLMEKLIRYQN